MAAEAPPQRASAGGPAARGLLALLSLLALVVALHAALIAALSEPHPWGDENHYRAFARADRREGNSSLLPGTLVFDHRPELAARVFSLLDEPERGGLQRRVSVLHLVLLALALVLLWLTARRLELSSAGAWSAAALVGLLPSLGFHVHTLWPEILHAFLLCLALLAVVWSFSGRALWLAPAGLATGYALLTKSSLSAFVPLAALHIGLEQWLQARGRPPLARARSAAVRVLLYGGGVLVVVVPQLARNAERGVGWRLAANTWWNLELGLTLGPESENRQAAIESSLAYFTAADSPVERERLARERVLALLRARSLASTLLGQTGKLGRLLVFGASDLELALGPWRRWGERPPAWLRAAVVPDRLLRYALLGLGALGLALHGRRNAGWRHVALLAIYLALALLAVPFKFRFVLPLVPALALLAASVLERAPDLVRARAGQRSSPSPP